MSNLVKIFSAFLLMWYGIARWIILGITNEASIDWLTNSFGNFIAVCSIVYLLFSIFKPNPQKVKWFVDVTKALTGINAYFLVTMIAIYLKSKSMADFGYLMLDISILSYFIIVLKICYMTNDNSNQEKSIEIPVIV